MAALKGGVGKTTSAIHIAAYLAKDAETVLVDSDKNASALTWSKKELLPFKVCSIEGAAKYIRSSTHVVIDTAARPSAEDLKGIAQGCDLLILPTSAKALDLDALIQTANILDELVANYKVLLTMIPSRRRKPCSSVIEQSLKEKQARSLLASANIPVFESAIVQYTAFERAPLWGVTVDRYPDRYAKEAWQCYQGVGQEIVNGK